MARSQLTLRIVHDLKTGATQFGTGNVNGAVSFEVNEFPEVLIYGVSMSVTFVVWTDQANADAFEFDPSTCTLYGRPLESGIDRVQLGQTVVSSTANEVTIAVGKDLIPASWASYSDIALLLDIDGTLRTKIYQRISIVAPDVTPESGVSSGDYAPYTATLTSDTTLTNVVGSRTYFLDSTAGAFTVHLPVPGSHPAQKIEFLHIAGANDVNIDPATYEIDGSTDDVPMILGDVLDVREYVPSVGAANWKNFNVTALV